VKPALQDLQRRADALRADLHGLGARAAVVAAALASSLPPDETLIDDLDHARRAFVELRAAVLDEGDRLAVLLPDPETIVSMQQLGPVFAAIIEADRREARQAAWDAARDGARTVLDRVLDLVHRDDPGFGALSTCQAEAREVEASLAGPPSEDVDSDARRLGERVQPFADLLRLAADWEVLDDDQCASLEDAITHAFGRPLALAALRGRLISRTVAPPDRPHVTVVSPAPEVPAVPAEVTGEAAPAGAVAPADSPTVTESALPSPLASDVDRSADVVPPEIVLPVARPTAAGFRAAGDGSPDGETPEARQAREARLEALAARSAPWWVAARAGWLSLHERGVRSGDAVRETLKRHPHLLSIPIQASAEHDDGALATGYALLLDHVEKQEPGFVTEALMRLNPQLTTGAREDSYPLGRELYLYLVAEGRLYKTYPDFVKSVLVATLPDAGPWIDGGIVETDAQTEVWRAVGEAPAGARESAVFTDAGERGRAHVFTSTLPPLTSRFFTVEAGDLAQASDVDVKVTDDGAPADRAWLVMLPPAGVTESITPRRHRAGGSALPGLGTAYRTLWIGLFNPDTEAERRYTLGITLARKTGPAEPAGSSAPPVAETASPFATRRRLP
jgi:hypothetical protein